MPNSLALISWRCYDGARTSRNVAENFLVMKRQSGDRENRKLHVIHLSKLSPSCVRKDEHVDFEDSRFLVILWAKFNIFVWALICKT